MLQQPFYDLAAPQLAQLALAHQQNDAHGSAPAEVDGKTDEHDHHEACGDQPDADRASLVTDAAGHDRSRNESSGEVTVAVRVYAWARFKTPAPAAT